MIQRMKNDLWHYRELIKQLALRDLKSRYKVSVLGFFWSLLRPLLTIVVLAAVFSTLDFKSQVYTVAYWVILPAAYVPWFYFSTGLLEGTQSFLANAHLVKKVYCPPAVFPSAVVLSNLINFLLSLVVLIPLLYLFTPAIPAPALILLPVVIGFHTLFLLGLCCFCSTLNVLYRDTTQIVEFLVFVWFYVSPVLYDMFKVRDDLSRTAFWVYCANPMTGIVEAYRYVFLQSADAGLDWYHSDVLWKAVPYSFAVSVVVFLAGYGYLKYYESSAVDRL